MEELNKKILSIGRNIFKQIELNKNGNVIVKSKDMQLLFEYIFAIEKAYDKLKEEKQEENVKS